MEKIPFYPGKKENEMFIIDQHAGHERQLYDKIMKEINNNEVTTQSLLVPYVMSQLYAAFLSS